MIIFERCHEYPVELEGHVQAWPPSVRSAQEPPCTGAQQPGATIRQGRAGQDEKGETRLLLDSGLEQLHACLVLRL